MTYERHGNTCGWNKSRNASYIQQYLDDKADCYSQGHIFMERTPDLHCYVAHGYKTAEIDKYQRQAEQRSQLLADG